MGVSSDVADRAAPIEVLVVEDDELVRRMLVRVLGRRGFVTHEAPDGATALRLVRDHEIDIVLLDNGLPDIAGTEVLAALRSEPGSATLPVILVTGQADIEARVGGLRAGANDYIVKPVNMDELVARVHAQIRGRDAWRSQVQEKLHERAQLAAALAAIPPSDDPAVVGRDLVEVLSGIPGVNSSAVVEFVADGSYRVLAASNPVWVGPDRPPVDPLMIQEIRHLTADGTLILPTRFARAISTRPHDAIIGTPIEVGGRVVASVLLATEALGGAEGRAVTLEALSATIDLSPVIQRLLASAIEARSGSQSLVSIVRNMIDEGAFRPVFQRLVDLSTGRTTGYEALTRFADAMPPDQRFAEAHSVGLGLELEIATLSAALRHAAELPPDRYLSVNVSASLLTSGRLAEVLELGGERALVLELTEHERIDDYEVIRTAFEGLGPGLRWSVDDAGSGWSSLRHVFALRPHFVKLDRSWVSGIDADRARQALLLGVGRFVEELDGDLIAEGIETEAERETLRSLGIRYGQGYLLGKPASVDEAALAP